MDIRYPSRENMRRLPPRQPDQHPETQHCLLVLSRAHVVLPWLAKVSCVDIHSPHSQDQDFAIHQIFGVDQNGERMGPDTIALYHQVFESWRGDGDAGIR
jgi:hypothetical protein